LRSILGLMSAQSLFSCCDGPLEPGGGRYWSLRATGKNLVFAGFATVGLLAVSCSPTAPTAESTPPQTQTSTPTPTQAAVACPSIEQDVTARGYGSLTFGHVGDDSVAREIILRCGWHVFGGNNGGFGNQLEIASPGEEVVLEWSWNNFEVVRLRRGWVGKSDRGLKLGDSRSQVFQMYQELTSGGFFGRYVNLFPWESVATYTSADKCAELNVAFDQQGRGAVVELQMWSPEQFYGGASSIRLCDGTK
jgi:hypothetical protein